MDRRAFLCGSGQVALSASLARYMNLIPTKAGARRTVHDGEQLISTLTKLIPRLMQEAGVPGLSVAIVRNGKLNWQKGFGMKDADTREPVDGHTVFEAASVSKTVFAYAVLKQCEKGVIGLDTPLVRYAPSPLTHADPRFDTITARHVLSHTTGFQNIRSGDDPLKIHFQPGSQFDYSGEGYWYLQSILSHLAGRENPNDCGEYEAGVKICATDIDTFLKRNLLVPFGMKASGYVWNDEFARHASRPHDVSGKPLPKSQPKAKDAARYAAMGGLHTTSADYAKFLIEVLNPKPADAYRLNKTSHDEMLTPQIRLKEGEKVDDADAWALGWAIRQRPTGDIILHSGGQSGFRSLTMGSVQCQSGFVMLTNSDNGGNVLFHPALATALTPLFVK